MAGETFGDVVIHMLYTIINGIIGTVASVLSDMLTLFSTLKNNAGSLSPLSIIIAVLIMGLILFGLFKLFKGQVKPLIIAVIILSAIMMVLLLI